MSSAFLLDRFSRASPPTLPFAFEMDLETPCRNGSTHEKFLDATNLSDAIREAKDLIGREYYGVTCFGLPEGGGWGKFDHAEPDYPSAGPNVFHGGVIYRYRADYVRCENGKRSSFALRPVCSLSRLPTHIEPCR